MPLTPFQAEVLGIIAENRRRRLADEAENQLLQAAQRNAEIGVAFLTPEGTIGWHDAAGAKSHQPTLGGVLPRLTGFHYPVD